MARVLIRSHYAAREGLDPNQPVGQQLLARGVLTDVACAWLDNPSAVDRLLGEEWDRLGQVDRAEWIAFLLSTQE